MIWIILIISLVFILFIVNNNSENKKPNTNQKEIVDIDVPNPENSNPKSVIEFIDGFGHETIKQVYNQLISLNKKIPPKLDAAFKEKIENGFLIKENYLWNISIENRKIIEDDLEEFPNKHSFELKGLQENKYREKLKGCIIYEEVYLESEPQNKFDQNAVKVECLEGIIGYVPANETNQVKEIMEKDYKAYIENVERDLNFITVYIVLHYK